MRKAVAYIVAALGLLCASASNACYDEVIKKPAPFMGNNGEVFVLGDGSVWEIRYEYEYLYEYYPNVTVCPDKDLLIINGQKLNAVQLSDSYGRSSTYKAPSRPFMKSRIDGTWQGWRQNTVVKLANGQVWEQVGLELSLAYRLNPKVSVYQRAGSYFMAVEGENNSVRVKRLH